MSSRRQPHRLPPPITFGAEALDGGAVLNELPGDAALFLWKSLRDLRLWADVRPEERPEAFGPDAYVRRRERLQAAEIDPELRGLLLDACELLRSPREPGAALAPYLPLLAWAEGRDLTATALELAQAIALAAPEDAARAREVALLARRRADYARAESWFRQAMWAARRTPDWKTYVRSSIGLGTVHLQRGNLPAAHRAHLRALRRARRQGFRELVARSHHELAVVFIHMDRRTGVVNHARAALRAYGPGHANLPALAHDIAAFWMHRGYFAEALRVFQALAPRLTAPVERLARASAVVRTAAAVGEHAAYEAAWNEAVELLRLPHAAQGDVRALLAMARGAASLGDRERAREMAERALGLARERGEGKQLLDAEGVLDSIAAGSSLLPPQPARGASQGARKLAEELVAAVEQGAHAA